MRYIGRFRHTGSICPSSPALARAMFDAAVQHFSLHDEIIFAGIGNGIIAEQFAALDKRVVFVDIDPEFCRRFQPRLGPAHEIVCADLNAYLAARTTRRRPPLVVSCLPMRGIFRSQTLRRALWQEAENGATVIFYSYIPYAPWRAHVAGSGSSDVRVSRLVSVIRNIPPAFVFSLWPDATAIDG